MTNCSKCGNEITANFCGDCGQAAQLKRIDGHYLRHEITHILHLEKGIFFTIKELLFRPGKTIRAFIWEDRNRLVKPVLFLIVMSLIYSLVSHWIHMDEPAQKIAANIFPVTQYFLGWVMHHYGYANLILSIFIAMWLKLFFKKQGYNFFELMILLCYTLGMSMLFLTLFLLMEALLPITGYLKILVYIYCAWVIVQFYEEKSIGSYFKALTAYFLGISTFFLGFIIPTVIIDIIIIKF